MDTSVATGESTALCMISSKKKCNIVCVYVQEVEESKEQHLMRTDGKPVQS